MWSYTKDHSRRNVKPMRVVAIPRVPTDGKLVSSSSGRRDAGVAKRRTLET